MELGDKFKILTEGAKYDVSCSSSGSNTGSVKGSLGNAAACGICHSFTSDGRCISLLKVLLSNHCIYDCVYCVNRRSNDVLRARLTPSELCDIAIGFYRRNYIEGLFLSSAVDISPNHTMSELTEVVRILRQEHNFRGYIHLKGIPGADSALIDYASTLVDRMSFNIELPTEKSLLLLAPQKKKEMILSPMKQLANTYILNQLEKPKVKKIPAGQTTQMIVGASSESDGLIVRLSESLYNNFKLKRVYYSSYIPVNKDNSLLPYLPTDYRREHRLYEADWLLRFYGFNASELLPHNRNLSLDIDVKSDWALHNYDKFPVEINTAEYETLLRIPGIGIKNAYRISRARLHHKLTFDSLKKMRVVLKRAAHFITVDGKFYGKIDNPEYIRRILSGNTLYLENKKRYVQLSIFDNMDTKPDTNVITGEF